MNEDREDVNRNDSIDKRNETEFENRSEGEQASREEAHPELEQVFTSEAREHADANSYVYGNRTAGVNEPYHRAQQGTESGYGYRENNAGPQYRQPQYQQYQQYQQYRQGQEQRSMNGAYYGGTARQEKPAKRKTGHIILSVVLAALLFVSLIGGSILGLKYMSMKRQTSKVSDTPTQEVTADNRSIPAANADQDSAKESESASLTKSGSHVIASTDTSKTATAVDVSDIVETVMPSVVAVTDNLEISRMTNPYNYFFGYGGSSEPDTQQVPASGSGVIIGQNDTELLIVTNNHVVDNSGNYTSYSVSSTGLTITFDDGTTASATVKGTDSGMDLAVISVNLSELSEETMNSIRVASIGSSDEIKVGSGVIAIGNALGYGQSVTFGVVSAKDREVTINNNTRLLLQTDAAINPGNSGGGLFNLSGELIGINCAKYESTDVEGMGFAIPITSSEEIIEDLMNQVVIPEEDQGYMGIVGETVPSAYITRYGYPEGVSVTQITAGSPAEEAGLQIYDIITKVDGREVKAMAELKKQVNKHMAGETITVTVMRPEGRSFSEFELDITLVRQSDITELGQIEEGAKSNERERRN